MIKNQKRQTRSRRFVESRSSSRSPIRKPNQTSDIKPVNDDDIDMNQIDIQGGNEDNELIQKQQENSKLEDMQSNELGEEEYEPLQIVLHKFSREQKNDIMTKCDQFTNMEFFNNLPTKLTANRESMKNLFVVCYDKRSIDSIASYISDQFPIVSFKWLHQLMESNSGEIVKIIPPTNLYTFLYSNFAFYLFDAQNPNIDDYSTSQWHSGLQKQIEQNYGEVTSDFKEFQSLTESNLIFSAILIKLNDGQSLSNSKEIESAINQLITTFKLTHNEYAKFRVVSEGYVIDGIKDQEIKDIQAYDLSALYKIIKQNNQEIFDANKKEENVEMDTINMTLEEKIKYINQLQPGEKIILEDCNIHIFDNSLNPRALQLCNLMGAMITDSIIPFLTTHVVTNKMSLILKQQLTSIQSRAFESTGAIKTSHSSSGQGINQLLNIKIVKMDWLVDSIMKEKKVDEKHYHVQDLYNDSSSINQELPDTDRRRQYIQRSVIFMGKAFTLCKQSYGEPQKQRERHQIEKAIIEMGGCVYDDPLQAKFIIQEDGIDNNCWSWLNESGEDQQNRRLTPLHFRFIQQCIQENSWLKHDDSMHLCPLPQKVPVRLFSQVCVEMCNIKTQLDLLIFSQLVKLYGFKRYWKDGVTTHLVVMSDEDYAKSKKLDQIKSFNKKPQVVNIEWLLDTMTKGQIVDGTLDEYKFDPKE